MSEYGVEFDVYRLVQVLLVLVHEQVQDRPELQGGHVGDLVGQLVRRVVGLVGVRLIQDFNEYLLIGSIPEIFFLVTEISSVVHLCIALTQASLGRLLFIVRSVLLISILINRLVRVFYGGLHNEVDLSHLVQPVQSLDQESYGCLGTHCLDCI